MNIKDREGHFFSSVININDFDPDLLHVDRTAVDYDFIVYDVKYVKNLNRIDSLYIVSNNIDVISRKSGKVFDIQCNRKEQNNVRRPHRDF